MKLAVFLYRKWCVSALLAVEMGLETQSVGLFKPDWASGRGRSCLAVSYLSKRSAYAVWSGRFDVVRKTENEISWS
jgi:hypothetical protein